MHVMMVVMPMMMPMPMVMVHRFGSYRCRPFRGASDRGLREGIAGKTARQHGGRDKGFHHGEFFLCFGRTPAVQ